jgi:hypothetical protein
MFGVFGVGGFCSGLGWRMAGHIVLTRNERIKISKKYGDLLPAVRIYRCFGGNLFVGCGYQELANILIRKYDTNSFLDWG